MLKGIDTSHHSVFDLHQLKEIVTDNRLYFNFIKATEGATIQDAKFTAAWEMSRQAGLICGAYHFFRPLTDINDQVHNFVTQYKKVSRAGVLPPVADIEWATVQQNGHPVEQWSQLAAAQRIPKIKMFLLALEARLNIRPVIYTAPTFWKEFINPSATPADNIFFDAFKLWVVDLRATGTLPIPWEGSSASFVQTHLGEKPATSGLYARLDQDVFSGSLKDLLNFTAPGFAIMRGFPFSNIVKDLQIELIQKGLLTSNADGIFGSDTETAVKNFQSGNQLFSNGIVDAQTWNKLLPG